jgi:hypothetical protein
MREIFADTQKGVSATPPFNFAVEKLFRVRLDPGFLPQCGKGCGGDVTLLGQCGGAGHI